MKWERIFTMESPLGFLGLLKMKRKRKGGKKRFLMMDDYRFKNGNLRRRSV
jgi:hypothetical protein